MHFELILATHNLNKFREFRELLKPFKNIELLSLAEWPDYKLPEETGATFLENANIKAQDAAKTLKKWVLADDSGLTVPYLKGEPGVHSSRFAGPQAKDKENRKKLLEKMREFVDLQRAACFECALSLADPNGKIVKSVQGICEGLILEEERGSKGFGYDSLFIKHDYDKSFGELDEATKIRVSHRAKAFEKLIPTLETLNRVEK